MSEPTHTRKMCPYMGLAGDPDSCFSYPEMAHRCFATGAATQITLEHQSAFCLTREYPTCPRIVEAQADDLPTSTPGATVSESEIEISSRLPLRVIAPTGLAGLLVVVAILFSFLRPVFGLGPVTGLPLQAEPRPTNSVLATATATKARAESSPTPVVVALLSTPSATPTALSGDRIYSLSPDSADIGWVVSSGERQNHFGDSFLYAGIFEEQVYQAAFKIDLSPIPRGAPIHRASLQLTGLRGDRLGTGGAWTLRLLAPEIDQGWRQHGFQEIFNARAILALQPVLGDQDLMEGQANLFELSPAQIKELEKRIVEFENPSVSFRIDGPLVGSDSLFAWDTGYGSESRGDKVTLSLSVGPPPATPPPYDYVVVTSTPTPENVLTAAAIVAQTTADASRIGTATPIPSNIVTATPIPEYLIITATPTPENEATAQSLAAVGTAEALTTGTPTPLPTDAVTATPTPSPTPTPTYILVTATPTPESLVAAATLAAAGTAQARRLGTPTPLPANAVTPIVVTSTPTPANEATAQALANIKTLQALATGTPTATPVNLVTATPTPVLILLDGELPPLTPTPASTVMPEIMPRELIGRIAFKSDRTGQEEIYAINPDGSGLALLSDRWPYDLAKEADVFSSDGRFRIFVKDAIIDTGTEDGDGNFVPIQLNLPSLFFFDSLYEVEEQVTRFGEGIAYEPAWSPTAEQIAFVSDDSGNDEIWVINRDGSDARQLTRNQWEWDKHPSWSPDGTKIVFWSNRTGHGQIWVMDADGGNLHSLSRTGFNDWDPVWIKYPRMPEFKAAP